MKNLSYSDLSIAYDKFKEDPSLDGLALFNKLFLSGIKKIHLVNIEIRPYYNFIKQRSL